MKCKRCKKECLESELTNGFCSECYKKYGNDVTELKNIKNPIARYFETWTTCCIIVGIILVIIAVIEEYGFLTILGIASSVAVIAMLLRAIAEIIQLLEDIKNK